MTAPVDFFNQGILSRPPLPLELARSQPAEELPERCQTVLEILGRKGNGSDLLEQAVLAREMVAGNVEPLRVPTNCLDVLAQQIVAMVAVDNWEVNDLFRLLRRAYPFRSTFP